MNLPNTQLFSSFNNNNKTHLEFICFSLSEKTSLKQADIFGKREKSDTALTSTRDYPISLA